MANFGGWLKGVFDVKPINLTARSKEGFSTAPKENVPELRKLLEDMRADIKQEIGALEQKEPNA